MALRLLPDSAITEQLRPGLGSVAESLAALIPELPSSSPVLVSGDWGSGKTSLLRTVRARLDGLVLDERARSTVWFDAWHHEGEEGLLPALMRRVWESTPAAYRGTEKARGLFARVSRFAIALGARALPLLVKAIGLGGLGDLLKELTSRKIADEVSAIPLRESEPALDAVEELRRGFAQLVGEAWPAGPPTIFIDDLDRCSPDGAVALLDAIRMLITGAADSGCRFVVALDRAVVVAAISAKFEKIHGYDGNRYLEKLFPIEFHVPPPGRAEADALLNELLFDERDQRTQLALNQALSDPLFSNPRLMKRCINRFRLARHFEARMQDALGIEPPDGSSELASDQTLAQWIAATERWPQLRALMRQYDGEAWKGILTEFWDTTGDPLSLRPEVRALRDQPGLREWMRRADLGGARHPEFRAADDRLRATGL